MATSRIKKFICLWKRLIDNNIELQFRDQSSLSASVNLSDVHTSAKGGDNIDAEITCTWFIFTINIV